MLVCARCGRENPEDASFCLACGNALAAVAPSREMRKTVTVVFTDVTGSTSLGESLDPESLRRVMSRYFDTVKGALERHGGTVEKFIGDAVMAVFGIPHVHEDDAVRAVRAVWEARAELDRLNEELEATWGVRLEARIGVNTGEVVAGDAAAGQALVTGDAVNVAARLEQSASPGQVLIGEATYKLARDVVGVEAAEALDLKGKSEPIAAYTLTKVAMARTIPTRRLDSPIVGRAQERSLLVDAFDRTRRESSCHLFTVMGAAGVGKSRLVEDFVARVTNEGVVARGRCLSYGEGNTFWPIQQIVKELASIHEDDEADEAISKIEKCVLQEPDASAIANRVAETIGLAEATTSSQEGFWGIRKFLEVLGRTDPIVVVWEDIHWAEPTLLDLIEHIADWSHDASILLLCAARPELLDERPAWSGGKFNATSILLEPLTDSECDGLIDNLLGTAGLAEGDKARIRGAAEGNPLFVEEMLAMLIEDGILERNNGSWIATSDLSQIAMPLSIQALLAARLDRLHGEERQALECASVVGKVFYSGAVAELCPDRLRTTVPGHLMALVRKELIRPTSSDFAGDDAFRFRHILIRDAAYDAMPKEMRAELHERFARWLQNVVGDRLAEYEEIIGHHYEQAYRYLGELGVAGEKERTLAEAAAAHLGSAGRRAYSREDMPAASSLLARAASFLKSTDVERARLLFLLCDALNNEGRFEEAVRAAEEASDIGRAVGDELLEGRAEVERLLVMSDVMDQEGWIAAATGVAERTIELFEIAADHESLARAWSLMAWVKLMRCRWREVEFAVSRAADSAKHSGQRRLIADTQRNLFPSYLFGPAHVEEGLRIAREMERDGASRSVLAFAYGVSGVLLAMQGKFDEARAMRDKSRAMNEDLGLKVETSSFGFVSAPVEYLAGDLDAAAAECLASIEALGEIGERGFRSTLAAMLGDILYEQGRYDEADEYALLGKDLGSSEDIATQMMWREVHAKVLARRGELEEAEALAREAVDIADQTDFSTEAAEVMASLGEVLAVSGRPEDAVPPLGRALEMYEAKGNLVMAERIREKLSELTRSH